MLDTKTAYDILNRTEAYWHQEITTAAFGTLASGKEIGHRIADYVEEKTTDLLSEHFVTRRQYGPSGKKMDRSMGDIWVFSNEIFNPVNVKAGEVGKKGQPNMVALKKLLRALLLRQIDSYYLLIVKMALKGDARASVYLVELLDYLDYVTFDSGPGQIMLKEREFYEMMEDKAGAAPLILYDETASGEKPLPLSIDAKIGRLFYMLEDGDRRLLKNRENVRASLQKMWERYQVSGEHKVTQEKLRLR